MGIANDMKNLGEDIVASYDMRVKAIGVLVKDTHNMLKGFQAEHKEMAANLRGELAKGEEERLKDFKAMMAEIQKFVSDIAEEVSAMIKRFQEEHKAMANEQRKNLEKGETDRLKDFKDMMGDITKGIKEIENYVANKLKEFHDTHADMSKELKKDLDKYVAGIVSETKKLMKDYEGERKKMATNWQSMATTMAKKRGIKPKVEAEVKVRPVEKVIEEVKAEEVPSEIGLEKRVLEYIKRHPEGVKVGDMEEPLGVARTRLGVIAKKLLDEGKVRKEENMYFTL